MQRLHPSLRTSLMTALVPLCILASLAGCASSKPSLYHQEDCSETDTYSRTFSASEAASCEAARRALLGQGYIISKAPISMSKLLSTSSAQPMARRRAPVMYSSAQRKIAIRSRKPTTRPVWA